MNDNDYSETELKKRVLQYLHLEFGESFHDGSALKLSELEYEGEFDLDGKTKLCWSFPSGSYEMWATAHQSTSYDWVIGMQKKPDFGKPKSGYEKLHIEVGFGDKQKTFQFEFEAQDEVNWEVESEEIVIDKKRNIVIGSTVNFSHRPPMVTLHVDYDNRSYNFTCSQSIYANFPIEDDVHLMINVGDIDDTFIE